MNIAEDYVSFEIAKLLKEKGFNWDCITYYVDSEPDDVKYSLLFENNTTWEERCCSAPTHQMVCKWLREFHNIFISIVFCTYPTEKKVTWTPEISTFDSVFPESAIEYDSYEEAVKAAIKYALENLI